MATVTKGTEYTTAQGRRAVVESVGEAVARVRIHLAPRRVKRMLVAIADIEALLYPAVDPNDASQDRKANWTGGYPF